MRTRALLIVSLVVVGGVVFAGAQRAPSRAPAARRGDLAISAVAARGRVLDRGARHRYEVSLSYELRHGDRTDSATSEVTGAWTVAYAGDNDRGRMFRAELVDVTGAHGDIARAAARPYFFTTTEEGRVLDLAIPVDLDDGARGILGTLAATFQMTERSASAFETQETDTFGRYRARYARTARGLHRKRVDYEHVVGDGVLQATVVETGTDFALRADGWPAEIIGKELTRIGTEQLVVHVGARFRLVHAGVTRGVELGSAEGLAVVPIDAAARGRSQASLDRELVDGALFADLIAELARVGDDPHARGYQLLRLSALFRLDDEAARAAGSHVRDGNANAEVVIGALGEAGSPVAQRVLGELVAERTVAADARLQASAALGLSATPTTDTLRTLAAASQGDGDLASTALLARGNAALRLSDGDPSAAGAVVDDLLARLRRATEPSEIELVIRALGNTGDPRIVPALSAAFSTGSLAIQVASTEALRLVPGADGILAKRLDHPASAVRIAAVFTVSGRPLDPFLAILDRRARADVDVEVRRAIVDLASTRRGEHRVLDEIASLSQDSR